MLRPQEKYMLLVPGFGTVKWNCKAGGPTINKRGWVTPVACADWRIKKPAAFLQRALLYRNAIRISAWVPLVWVDRVLVGCLLFSYPHVPADLPGQALCLLQSLPGWALPQKWMNRYP